MRGLFEHLAEQIEADARDEPALLGAEQVAGAAQLHVQRRDLEARPELGVALQRLDAASGLVAELARRRHQEVAVGAFRRATDSTAELIELRQAEHVGAIDDDGVGARDVEAALDDRGRDQDVVLALDEVEHRLLQRRLAHLSVPDGDARPGTSSCTRAARS